MTQEIDARTASTPMEAAHPRRHRLVGRGLRHGPAGAAAGLPESGARPGGGQRERRLPGWHIERARSSWEGAWSVVATCGTLHLGFQVVPGHGLAPGDAWLHPEDRYARERLGSISDSWRALIWFAEPIGAHQDAQLPTGDGTPRRPATVTPGASAPVPSTGSVRVVRADRMSAQQIRGGTGTSTAGPAGLASTGWRSWR